MTDHEFELRLRTDLRGLAEPASVDLRTRVIAIADEVPTVVDGSLMPDWRSPVVLRFAPLALVAAALLVMALVGIGLFLRRPDVGPAPAPFTTEPSASATPRAKSYSMDRGKVTFAADSRWEESDAGPWALRLDGNVAERIHVVAEPSAFGDHCLVVWPGDNAEQLAQGILSDPDLVATPALPVVVGGVDALRMDVVASSGASRCGAGTGVYQETLTTTRHRNIVLGARERMRLYLLDLPNPYPLTRGGGIVAIAIIAPEAGFDRVAEAAAPVLDSFEFPSP